MIKMDYLLVEQHLLWCLRAGTWEIPPQFHVVWMVMSANKRKWKTKRYNTSH